MSIHSFKWFLSAICQILSITMQRIIVYNCMEMDYTAFQSSKLTKIVLCLCFKNGKTIHCAFK